MIKDRHFLCFDTVPFWYWLDWVGAVNPRGDTQFKSPSFFGLLVHYSGLISQTEVSRVIQGHSSSYGDAD